MEYPSQPSTLSVFFRAPQASGVHLARSHSVWSPSRHYTVDDYCLGCLKWYGSVRQVQQHLKHSGSCLLRLCQVIAPLDTTSIRTVEAKEVARQNKICRSDWSQFQSRSQQAVVYEPKIPTAQERTEGLDFSR